MLSRGSNMKPSICLAMIVRNERQVIERCLRSAMPLIDAWVICDTGSTDGTPDVIRHRLADVPGVLHERPWRNFGVNRTELLTLAKSQGDYLLLLDADMVVEGSRRALDSLDKDAYYVRVAGGDPEYWMPYLIRASLPWRYMGATHEYLHLERPFSHQRLDGVSIRHHADGGSRHDKFERDRQLLAAELAEDPTNARAVFYLAQTLRDLGEHEQAVKLYRRRAAMGGWDEEIFYSLYQVGVLLTPVDWPGAAAALLEAWNARPPRAEPLYQLAVGFRQRQQYAAAHLFASRGLTIAMPQDLLFLSPWVYQWGLWFEYSIAAYWVGDIKESLAACERVLAHKDLPEPWLSHARQNRQICQRALARRQS